MNTTLDYAERARNAAGNWHRFTSFVWFEKPDESDEWAIVYGSNRDSGPLERANAKAIAKELEPFDEDVRTESHSHWAVGYVDGWAIRVYRDGEITEAFRTWCDLQDRLDDYPVLDDDLHSQEEQEEIDASWKAWVEWDFRRALKEKFNRKKRLIRIIEDAEDGPLFELFSQQEAEWWEDGGGMTFRMERVIEGISEEDVRALAV